MTSSIHANFSQRRQRLLAAMQARGGGIAILGTAPEVIRNNDAHFPFRHDSFFYYLTGFTEPEAVLVLVADADSQKSILFCRDKNLEREIWDGYRFGPAAAQVHLCFDAAFSIDELKVELPRLLSDAATLFYTYNVDAKLDAQMQFWLDTVRAKARSGVTAPGTSVDVRQLVSEMRLFKDEAEIALMQRAAVISGAAHARAMRCAQPGKFEYELEAELLHEFRRQGSQAPAYNSIVATGANACVLHYVENNAQIKDGDLILIDAGCEVDSYASDITRTFPANGRFSPAQKTLYELVLSAQQAALACAHTGSRYMDGHNAAVRVLTQGMLDTGLLDANKVGSLDDAIASNVFKQFYMHGTGHWLGMDVHDVGAYRETQKVDAEKPYRRLEAGMVITVEPGIYVRPSDGVPEQYWNIGIRIEDDILITPEGHLNLSRDVPKTVAEIESIMR